MELPINSRHLYNIYRIYVKINISYINNAKIRRNFSLHHISHKITSLIKLTQRIAIVCYAVIALYCITCSCKTQLEITTENIQHQVNDRLA